MILIDANVLIYAYNDEAAFHYECRQWLGDALSNTRMVGFAWQSITAFIRITTNPRLFSEEFGQSEAIEIVESWLNLPNVRILGPTDRHWVIFKRLMIEGRLTGPKIMDAHLAALAIEYGAVLATTDRDFLGFAGLTVLNPTTNNLGANG
jgi:hypothetical protein